jgi:Rrf2 family protein
MAAELAVRGIVVLGERYGQGPLPLEDICQSRALPRQYLAKLFAMLARANLIEAVRGKGGGYILAKPPAKITLLQVIEAIEGPLALNLCQSDPPKCEQAQCKIRHVWTALQQDMRRQLACRTLDQFV